MEKANQIRDGVVMAGDGRHDSMGHSAKYCAYTMFCCTLGLIVHFSLVQVEINSKMYHPNAPYFIVLLCVMPDNFTKNRRKACSSLKYLPRSHCSWFFFIVEKSGRKQSSDGVHGLQAMHGLHDYVWPYHNHIHIGQAFFHCQVHANSPEEHCSLF